MKKVINILLMAAMAECRTFYKGQHGQPVHWQAVEAKVLNQAIRPMQIPVHRQKKGRSLISTALMTSFAPVLRRFIRRLRVHPTMGLYPL